MDSDDFFTDPLSIGCSCELEVIIIKRRRRARRRRRRKILSKNNSLPRR
jgi:hypothetical protein